MVLSVFLLVAELLVVCSAFQTLIPATLSPQHLRVRPEKNERSGTINGGVMKKRLQQRCDSVAMNSQNDGSDHVPFFARKDGQDGSPNPNQPGGRPHDEQKDIANILHPDEDSEGSWWAFSGGKPEKKHADRVTVVDWNSASGTTPGGGNAVVAQPFVHRNFAQIPVINPKPKPKFNVGVTSSSSPQQSFKVTKLVSGSLDPSPPMKPPSMEMLQHTNTEEVSPDTGDSNSEPAVRETRQTPQPDSVSARWMAAERERRKNQSLGRWDDVSMPVGSVSTPEKQPRSGSEGQTSANPQTRWGGEETERRSIGAGRAGSLLVPGSTINPVGPPTFPERRTVSKPVVRDPVPANPNRWGSEEALRRELGTGQVGSVKMPGKQPSQDADVLDSVPKFRVSRVEGDSQKSTWGSVEVGAGGSDGRRIVEAQSIPSQSQSRKIGSPAMGISGPGVSSVERRQPPAGPVFPSVETATYTVSRVEREGSDGSFRSIPVDKPSAAERDPDLPVSLSTRWGESELSRVNHDSGVGTLGSVPMPLASDPVPANPNRWGTEEAQRRELGTGQVGAMKMPGDLTTQSRGTIAPSGQSRWGASELSRVSQDSKTGALGSVPMPVGSDPVPANPNRWGTEEGLRRELGTGQVGAMKMPGDLTTQSGGSASSGQSRWGASELSRSSQDSKTGALGSVPMPVGSDPVPANPSRWGTEEAQRRELGTGQVGAMKMPGDLTTQSRGTIAPSGQSRWGASELSRSSQDSKTGALGSVPMPVGSDPVPANPNRWGTEEGLRRELGTGQVGAMKMPGDLTTQSRGTIAPSGQSRWGASELSRVSQDSKTGALGSVPMPVGSDPVPANPNRWGTEEAQRRELGTGQVGAMKMPGDLTTQSRGTIAPSGQSRWGASELSRVSQDSKTGALGSVPMPVGSDPVPANPNRWGTEEAQRRELGTGQVGAMKMPGDLTTQSRGTIAPSGQSRWGASELSRSSQDSKTGSLGSVPMPVGSDPVPANPNRWGTEEAQRRELGTGQVGAMKMPGDLTTQSRGTIAPSGQSRWGASELSRSSQDSKTGALGSVPMPVGSDPVPANPSRWGTEEAQRRELGTGQVGAMKMPGDLTTQSRGTIAPSGQSRWGASELSRSSQDSKTGALGSVPMPVGSDPVPTNPNRWGAEEGLRRELGTGQVGAMKMPGDLTTQSGGSASSGQSRWGASELSRSSQDSKTGALGSVPMPVGSDPVPANPNRWGTEEGLRRELGTGQVGAMKMPGDLTTQSRGTIAPSGQSRWGASELSRVSQDSKTGALGSVPMPVGSDPVPANPNRWGTEEAQRRELGTGQVGAMKMPGDLTTQSRGTIAPSGQSRWGASELSRSSQDSKTGSLGSVPMPVGSDPVPANPNRWGTEEAQRRELGTGQVGAMKMPGDLTTQSRGTIAPSGQSRWGASELSRSSQDSKTGALGSVPMPVGSDPVPANPNRWGTEEGLRRELGTGQVGAVKMPGDLTTQSGGSASSGRSRWGASELSRSSQDSKTGALGSVPMPVGSDPVPANPNRWGTEEGLRRELGTGQVGAMKMPGDLTTQSGGSASSGQSRWGASELSRSSQDSKTGALGSVPMPVGSDPVPANPNRWGAEEGLRRELGTGQVGAMKMPGDLTTQSGGSASSGQSRWGASELSRSSQDSKTGALGSVPMPVGSDPVPANPNRWGTEEGLRRELGTGQVGSVKMPGKHPSQDADVLDSVPTFRVSRVEGDSQKSTWGSVEVGAGGSDGRRIVEAQSIPSQSQSRKIGSPAVGISGPSVSSVERRQPPAGPVFASVETATFTVSRVEREGSDGSFRSIPVVKTPAADNKTSLPLKEKKPSSAVADPILPDAHDTGQTSSLASPSVTAESIGQIPPSELKSTNNIHIVKRGAPGARESKVLQVPSWWVFPEASLQRDCINVRNLLNEPDFKTDVYHLAERALENAERDDWKVEQSEVSILGPAGMVLQTWISDSRGDLFSVGVSLPFEKTAETVDEFRQSVLGLIADAQV